MERNGVLPYVDATEAATILGVSVWAVLRDCESGKLPAERVVTQDGLGWRVLRDAFAHQNPSPPKTILTSADMGDAESALLELSREVTEVKSFIAGEMLSRWEGQMTVLDSAVKALTMQVQSLAEENARLREHVMGETHSPMTSAAQSLSAANAQLQEQLAQMTQGCRKLAQFIFDLEEAAHGSGTRTR
jgi:hypothetical protein